jgi:uncharacterized protein (DUF1501 family)
MSRNEIDRRTFLSSAAAAPLVAPGVLTSFGRVLPDGDGRSLVVLEFDGGNDGLNTILPVDDAAWAKARPKLAGVRKGAHALRDGFALHPGMAGVHRLMREGLACAVHGVGYAGSSRSHFKSRDVWHTADVGFTELRADTTGWLGRVADQLSAAGAAVPGLSVGSVRVPLMLKAKDVVVPSVRRIEEYQLLVSPGGDAARRRADLKEVVAERGGEGELTRLLEDTARSALDNAERLREALAGYRAKAEYPETALGRKLQLLARVLISGFGTRLFHVNFPGFDTHATQLPAHATLLTQFSAAVEAMVRDLRAHGKLDEVTVLVQSEFGRRVAQNKSRGTDHGKAGPVFLFGGGLRPGLHGEHPSLTDLDDGDLKPTTDFRKVYDAILRRMGLDPKAILGQRFAGLDVFA